MADKLDLEFREETESRRARKLCQRLRKEKKIHVVLDNIWTGLDLETIGIPFGDTHKGCKILLTTRDQNVLSSINCKNNIRVAVLKEPEAWSLFKKTISDDIENGALKSVAIDVAKECEGLPIAIVTIASGLRDKSIYEWKNTLQKLRRPSKRSFTGVQAEALCIELSYDHLKDEELKSIFLLCSLMSDSNYMLDLLKHSVGLGLLQAINTMEEARDRIYTLVHELQASSLWLQGCGIGEQFSVQDVVRDVALSIASRDQHVFTIRNEVVPIETFILSCYLFHQLGDSLSF